MKKPYLYKLHFETPVHFGSAAEGGKLEEAEMALGADSLFSALCCELSAQGEEDTLRDLVAMARAGAVRFSDLYPFREASGETAYYLPRPVLPPNRAAVQEEARTHSLRRERDEAASRKRLKKLTHLRAREMASFLAARRDGRPYAGEMPEFGVSSLVERVHCVRVGETLPYFVRQFTFFPEAGLYGLVFWEEDEAERLQAMLTSLGLYGIGGKRSSGYGKFRVAALLDLTAAKGADEAALFTLLQAKTAPWQMCLAALLPAAEEEAILREGWYRLLRRGGFITGARAGNQKKDSVHMVAAGSCLPQRLAGQMAVLGRAEDHEVLRYGYGLYAGLSL